MKVVSSQRYSHGISLYPPLCPSWFFVFFVILIISKEMDHKEHKEPRRTQGTIGKIIC